MEVIKPFIPLLIPVVLIELILLVIAAVDLVRREKTRGPKWMWALFLLVGIFGPIAYFIFGRREE